MKRDELKALELTDEQVNAVMKLYGQSVVELQNGMATAQAESEKATKALKRYEKGGEAYIDADEFKRLKTFETETLTKETNAKKTAALTKLYKGANASDSAIKLLIKGHNLDEVELDDKGELTKGTEYLNTAKAEYADFFSASGNTGMQHASNEESGASSTPTRAKIY